MRTRQANARDPDSGCSGSPGKINGGVPNPRHEVRPRCRDRGLGDYILRGRILRRCKGSARAPVICGQYGRLDCYIPMVIYNYKEREWRHENLGEIVCYIHAKVPKRQCRSCGTIAQVKVPWRNPKSPTQEVRGAAIQKMSLSAMAGR